MSTQAGAYCQSAVPPLYHGTNSLFLPSIRAHGLGGRNIVKEWRVLDLYKEVIECCRKCSHPTLARKATEDWSVQAVIGQWRQFGNWRHGPAYVAADKRKAISYAFRSAYGSELIDFTFAWLEDLERAEPGIDKRLMTRYQDLEYLRRTPGDPVLLEVSNLSDDDLETEQGQPVVSATEIIKGFASPFGESDASDINDASFALLRPAAWAQITPFRLVPEGEPRPPLFENVQCVPMKPK